LLLLKFLIKLTKQNLIEKIAKLASDKNLTGISDIRDESSKLGIRIVIDIKRGEPANIF
jgi:DNA gyrase subunit A